MPQVLMVGGPADGEMPDVDDDLPSIHWPNTDGTYSLYPRKTVNFVDGSSRYVYVLAGMTDEQALAALKRHA